MLIEILYIFLYRKNERFRKPHFDSKRQEKNSFTNPIKSMEYTSFIRFSHNCKQTSATSPTYVG
jgi:hypothetical protein